MPNKTAWVVGRGRAEVGSNLSNPSGPLVDFSKCYENSVPNPWVLVSSPQQSDQSRKCTVKSKDPELLHADRNPRTAMHENSKNSDFTVGLRSACFSG